MTENDPDFWRDHGVRIVTSAALDLNTPQTPGMTRAAAITNARTGATKLWAGTVIIHPNAKTGAHHHGELESVIYVVSGRARMRWGERLEFVAEAGPGDFIYVPAYVPHQEINANRDEPLSCVLVRSGQDPVVVNLELEPAEAPEEVAWVDSIHPAPGTKNEERSTKDDAPRTTLRETEAAVSFRSSRRCTPAELPAEVRTGLVDNVIKTRVSFVPDLRQDNHADACISTRSSAIVTAPRRPMLLVVDDESSRALLRHRLEGAGYEVTDASGHEALAYLDAHDVSIVLLDTQMPQMNGLEVLRAIRRKWTDAELPVLLLTAEGQAQDVATALELGANDYIITSVDFHVALARIRTQLARKDAEDRLHSSEERYKLAAEGANDGIWDWDLKTEQLYYSTRWKAIVGCSDEEVGTGSDEWFGRVHPEDLPRLHHELDEHLDGRSDHFEVEHRVRHKSGAFRWVLTRGLAVRDSHGRPIRMAGSQSDVTDGKIVDALTGLPNRVLLVDRLDRMLSGRRRQEGRHLAVLFLDLDGFKMVNDGMGHFYGDELLQAVAVRLRQSLRLSDTIARLADDVASAGIASGLASEHTIARLGGDEFVVLLHEVRDVVDATNIADRIHKALSAPFHVGGRELFTNASIGIALESPAYHRAEELLRDADTAMYRAKALGKGRSEVFDAEMREQVIERRHLDKALRLAVERREFVPFFQPIVDLATGKLSGFESLIRWRRPGYGIVGPGEFIPLLLENRLIVPVGRRFFGDVCQLLQGWQEAHPSRADLRININFAGPQFNEVDLLDRLIKMLDDTGLSPANLVVEVTESTVIADFAHAGEVLNRIRDAGFLIVLDDFGTGYSSLSCLEHLPICGIKLDRSFIARQSRAPVIMKAVISLAHQLGLTVTAEGIETVEQCELMRRLGCGFAQGYLFGRPEPAEAAGRLIEANPEWFTGVSNGTLQASTPARIVVTS